MFTDLSNAVIGAETITVTPTSADQTQAAALTVAHHAHDKDDLVLLLDVLGLPAGEDDLYVASMQIHVPASCKSSRPAAAHLSIETPGATTREVIGQGGYSESGNGGDKLATFQFVATELGHGALTAAPVAPLTHTFSIELDGGSCEGKAEVPSHITAVGAQIDVIGFR